MAPKLQNAADIDRVLLLVIDALGGRYAGRAVVRPMTWSRYARHVVELQDHCRCQISSGWPRNGGANIGSAG